MVVNVLSQKKNKHKWPKGMFWGVWIWFHGRRVLSYLVDWSEFKPCDWWVQYSLENVDSSNAWWYVQTNSRQTVQSKAKIEQRRVPCDWLWKWSKYVVIAGRFQVGDQWKDNGQATDFSSSLIWIFWFESFFGTYFI